MLAALHRTQQGSNTLCKNPACPLQEARRLAGGKGGEGREPRQAKDPNKRKAGLLPVAPAGPADR